ncbi:MAG TPA: GNAT family N-acetyltransferase [Glaciihabitans sp.]|jgi:RimJ/RimL family protein N-acetyltransferase|nr:GNAT family N-acetyltransferase [Glaciihabitans sp.]
MDYEMTRVLLHVFSTDDAADVLRGIRKPGQSWAREYPSFFEIDLLRSLVHERESGIDPGPFTQYQVVLTDENIVIGGAGFFGPPDEFRAVEISFGIAADYHGHRYGAEIVAGMVHIARTNGARFVIATATVADIGTQKSLEQGGLAEIVRDETTVHFGLQFDA